MSESASAQCHECGDDVPVTKAGVLRKHQADGQACPGGGVEPSPSGPVGDTDIEEHTPIGDDDDEGLFEDEDREEAEDTLAGPSPEDAPATLTPAAPATNTSGRPEPVLAPPAQDATSYTGTVTVKAPCPYLADASWHQANAQMIASRALKAGHTLVGPPRHIHSNRDPVAATITLTYQVRVT